MQSFTPSSQIVGFSNTSSCSNVAFVISKLGFSNPSPTPLDTSIPPNAFPSTLMVPSNTTSDEFTNNAAFAPVNVISLIVASVLYTFTT